MLKLITGIVAGLVVVAAAAAFLTDPVLAAQCRGTLMSASWYGTESGNRTANGEPFNGTSLTAAHRSLPFGTRLRVTYRGKAVTVRINDRGPYIPGRSLDLSRAAAAKIGMIDVGVACVAVEVL